MMQRAKTYDVAIIGAGLGGLSCGTLLAKHGARVAIFEHHDRPGGYCHSFKRGSYIFDAAIEYVGAAGADQDVTNALKLLGADRFVSFYEMEPDGFDRLYFPKHQIEVCRDIERYKERLTRMFPQEATGVCQYYDILESIWREVHTWGVAMYAWRHRSFPDSCPTLKRATGKNLDHLFDHCRLESRYLRAILCGQNGNYALPPSRVDLITHAIIIMHLHEGAFYPSGGVQSISDGIVKAFELKGGVLFLRHGVRRVIVRNGRVRGLELENGETISAKIVISNADPLMTLASLQSGEQSSTSASSSKANRLKYSLSSFQVYLGIKGDLSRAGLGARNHWICPSYDFDGIYGRLFNGLIPRKAYLLLTSQSLKDPSGRMSPPGRHVLKLLTPVSFDSFSEWGGTRLGRRGTMYRTRKERFAKLLINQASEIIPDLGKMIECEIVGSPLTNAAYTRTPRGAMYGMARTPTQSGPTRCSPISSIEGLYFTGTSVYYPGVLGALGSGVMVGYLILRQDKRLNSVAGHLN